MLMKLYHTSVSFATAAPKKLHNFLTMAAESAIMDAENHPGFAGGKDAAQ
ncbi:MAG: hypothetical protein IJF67_07255 [Clostridia bacterium]|nr:hypothetical protein [Clostridia bacterium]